MARKIPNSHKYKKTKLKEQRARKQATASDSSQGLADLTSSLDTSNRTTKPKTRKQIRRQKQSRSQVNDAEGTLAQRKSRASRIESRFVKLTPAIMERYKRINAEDRLERPVEWEMAVWEDFARDEEVDEDSDSEEEVQDSRSRRAAVERIFTVPTRPKWTYEMSKKEVEANEETSFKTWLQGTDSEFKKLCSIPPSIKDPADLSSLISPTIFERNLSVYRQLWRVSEQAHVLLVLLDARAPLLHLARPLRRWLEEWSLGKTKWSGGKGKRNAKKGSGAVILVLTKIDLVGSEREALWRRFLEKEFCSSPSTAGDNESTEGLRWMVVGIESYQEKDRGENEQGTHSTLTPAARSSRVSELVNALKTIHAQLTKPPPWVASDPERLKNWKSPITTEMDWKTGFPGDHNANSNSNSEPKPSEVENNASASDSKESDELEESSRQQPFTIGLIGQPNVGKTSLLNALLGRKVAKASKTPGKTKNFQTILMNPTIKIVDCPGLVFPSTFGYEPQVLSSLVPIQNVAPTIHWIAQRLPLEKVLRLADDETGIELPPWDYNEAGQEKHKERERHRWTTDELLNSYAVAMGFRTAQAARPDIYRAGHYLLRLLHSSSIPWAFLPPGIEEEMVPSDQEGIWLFKRSSVDGYHVDVVEDDDDGDFESEEEGFRSKSSEDDGSDENIEEENEEEDGEDDEEGEEEEEELPIKSKVGGAFAALAGDNPESEDSESEG